MKKLTALLLVTLLTFLQLSVYAESSATQDKYADLILEAIEKSDYSEEQIDKEHIYIIENTSPIPMRKNQEPIWIWVALPLLDSEDVSYAYFDKGVYGMEITNLPTFTGIEMPYGNTLKQYLEKNNLSEPTEITNMWIVERLHLFAYNAVCDGKEYIIPYHFTEESMFNLTNAEECNIEIGKAYTKDDFLTICEKEAELFAEYRKSESEQEETDSSKTYVDNNGEEVTTQPLTKVEQANDEKQTDKFQELINEDETKEETETLDEKLIVDCSEWAYEYVAEAIKTGLLDDMSNILYKESVTREFFCEIIFNLLSKSTEKALPVSSTNPFYDINNSKVTALYYEGIINGKGDKKFAPNDLLTREEAATILYRFAEYLELDIPQSTYTDDVDFYADKTFISDWAFNAVFYMNQMEIMVGTSDENFSPKETYTVEQAIATVMRLYNY